MLHLNSNQRLRSLLANLILGSLFLGLAGEILNTNPIKAQIIPDNTLGNERSNLTPQNIIEGGATRGANLFHSFSEFNIGEGQQVNFANPNGIQRIFSRVTGKNPSQIQGTLGVLGNADLFFINPNGILFGSNARLNVSGSFVASTADSIFFDNNFVFSASNPQSPALLTINVPLGLQFGSNPGNIQVQGSTLQVSRGQNLALVGGNVNLDNATLEALEGRVEIGGARASATVSLTVGDNPSFNFVDVNGADVSLTNRSTIDVMAGGGGEIAIASRNIDILQESALLIGIESGSGTPETQAGNVVLNASGEVRLDGQDTLIQNLLAPEAVGNGGNIEIKARSLFVTNGANIFTSNQGQGSAGGVNITTTDAVAIDGTSSTGIASAIGVQLGIGGIGKTGNLTLTTQTLSLTNGAQLGTATFGQGNAGNVTITAQTVSVDGVMQTGSRRTSSGITSSVAPRSFGNGGMIQIDTELLSVTNGGRLFSSTFGEGRAGDIVVNARDTVALDGVGTNNFPSAIVSQVATPGVGDGGNINIAARSLTLTNGSQLAVSSFGQGNAGNVRVNVRDTVFLDGVGRNNAPSGILTSLERNAVGRGGDIEIHAGVLSITNEAGLFASTIGTGDSGRIFVQTTEIVTLANGGRILVTVEPSAVGNSQGIEVQTRSLQVRDSAQISADSQGTGVGGDIRIQADSLTLDNQAAISAETSSNTGGNISLDVPNLLLLRRGSTLSTTAGTAQAGGDGGNITIAAGFLVAFPAEDSNIAADAFTGRGGNINITTQGIYGIEFRDRQTPLSDITASSQFGVNGVVNINTPEIDPAQGAIELPTTFSIPSLARGCEARGSETSSFVNTGRGGVPTNPTAPLIADTLWQDLELLGEVGKVGREESTSTNNQRINNPTSPIVEAQGWVVLNNGAIVLTAQAPIVTPYRVESQGSVFCH